MDPMSISPGRSTTGLARLRLLGATGLVLALAAALAAPPAAASVDPAVDGLITKRLDNPRLGTDVALLAIDAATGEIVSDRDSGRLMLPASNMKIVTAVTTLAALGPQARFTTRVRAGATPTDIVLEGGGDPLLSTKDLRKLANATAKVLPAGTPVVVHVDDDLLPRHRSGTRLDPLVHPLRRVVGRGPRTALGLQPRPQQRMRRRSSRSGCSARAFPPPSARTPTLGRARSSPSPRATPWTRPCA